MANYKISINYDGTNFNGWQIQTAERTVQGELQNSLYRIFHQTIPITGSSRTDAGVHAAAQVANFQLPIDYPGDRLKAAFNGTLPSDVRVLSVEIVDDLFNARFDATGRLYHYTISKQQYAIGRQYTYYHPQSLRTDLMREAARLLYGRHDFTSFCQARSEIENHVCLIETLDIIETDQIITIIIMANRFLHNMVRIIAGTLINIGLLKYEPETIIHILEAKDRRAAGKTLPPQGLCLVKVFYNRDNTPTT